MSTRKETNTNRQKNSRINWGEFLSILLITILPLWATRSLWSKIINGDQPRAWDGSGHFALAKIYSERIFPDTFGWVDSYYAGMPFPNFYPPLFYWLIGALSGSGVLSLLTAFKIIVSLPLVILPFAIWLLSREITGKNYTAVVFSGLSCALLLVDSRFVPDAPLGLDYFSTFTIGLYTQPLGFVLLLFWFRSYLKSHRCGLSFSAATLLLAGVILANFFSAVTACLFILVILFHNFIKLFRVEKYPDKKTVRGELIVKAVIPLLAFCLAAFWLLSALTTSDYFVTRPTINRWENIITPSLLIWYGFAAIGFWSWLVNPTENKLIYFFLCLSLVAVVFILPAFVPYWFPFQSNRFTSTLNFLLCLPVGECCALLINSIKTRLKRTKLLSVISRHSDLSKVLAVTLCLAVATILIRSQGFELAFYQASRDERVGTILDFADQHRDGRYLVEYPDPSFPFAQFDARAITSYLGAQPNKSGTVVFREASPQALFFNPLTASFSAGADNYGFSSTLADDLDFTDQPFSKNIERAKFLGIRYLIVISPLVKTKLVASGAVIRNFDFNGGWSVFEIGDTQPEAASKLSYLPSLVVTSKSFKGRTSRDLSFVRLAEEQFFNAWFDVLIAFSPQNKLDRIERLNDFGSLLVERYDYENIDHAFEVLQEFSKKRPLILFSDSDELFRRIENARTSFPKLFIIARPAEENEYRLDSEKPLHRYNSSKIRAAWQEIQNILDTNKIPVDQKSRISAKSFDEEITLKTDNTTGDKFPVLFRTSFHPNWQRKDDEPIYLVSPYYTLSFIDRDTDLAFSRDKWSILGVYLSVAAILVFILFILMNLAGFQLRSARKPVPKQSKADNK